MSLEDRGIAALAHSPPAKTPAEREQRAIERGTILGALAGSTVALIMTEKDFSTPTKILGVGSTFFTVMKICRGTANGTSSPAPAASGVDPESLKPARVNVVLNLGETVFLPAAGGMLLLLSGADAKRKMEGGALMGIAAAGGIAAYLALR